MWKAINLQKIFTMNSRSRLSIYENQLCSQSPKLSTSKGSAYLIDAAKYIVKAKAKGVGRVNEVTCLRFMEQYYVSSSEEKRAALEHIASQFGKNHLIIAESITGFNQASPEAKWKWENKLQGSLTAEYELLFKELVAQERGLKFLVDMRADVLSLSRQSSNPLLSQMASTLKSMLSLWFGVGFLKLEQITWQSASDILEKITSYEGVHPIRNVADLRVRVGPYRRVYIFTHPSMPREPLVILHVALVEGIAGNIQNIIRHPNLSEGTRFSAVYESEDVTSFNTAIFYSISSTQAGLQGIDLGNYLIKSVAKRLISENPHLSTFSSLSPIPGFRSWLVTELNQTLHQEYPATPLLLDDELRLLRRRLQEDCSQAVYERLKLILSNGSWAQDEAMRATLQPVLMRLSARYLYTEKHRGFALNSVANFHLRNGATLWRINYMANSTAKGLMESCGLMVNYRYYLDKTEDNSIKYLTSKEIHVDDQVLELMPSTAS